MKTILHLTTVHPRSDTRIFIKETKTIAFHLPHKVLLMVADGQGNIDTVQDSVSISDLGCLPGGRFSRVLLGSWRAFFAIRKIRPAIVHFHDPELIPLGMLLKLIGCKVIYDLHEDVPRQILSKHWVPWTIRKAVGRVMSGVEWLSSRIFDAMVPATPKIADRFQSNKTVMIQNFPISAELLLPYPTPYIERSLSFVYAGVISKVRGIAEIIQAVGLLVDIPDAIFDLAGTFSPIDLINTLRKIPGWTSVHYHGEVSRNQVATLLNGARAGLVLHHPVPNEIDAQPIKMFEYMAASIPVIASDFPVWRNFIAGTGCGLLVNPFDVNAIAEAMRWIITHPTEAKTMGQRGRQAVERTYNWGSEAIKLVDLYKRILAL